MLVLVSLSLFGTALGSFGVKQLDKGVWKCFVATNISTGTWKSLELKPGVCHHRVTFCELYSSCSAGVRMCLM